MNEIAKLSESPKECSVLQDCFQSQHFKELHISLYSASELRPSYFPSKPVWVRIQFKCGDTSGEQRMEADTILEAFAKIAAFQTEIERRNKNSEQNCTKNE